MNHLIWRMFRLSVIGFLTLVSYSLPARDVDCETAHGYTTQEINEHFYLLMAGTPEQLDTIGLVVGESGVVLIDSGIAGKEKQLLAAIRDVSDKPLQFVMNTHSHADHSGGNKFFADLGATIISQQNAQYSNAHGEHYFGDSYTLDIGSEKIEAKHTVSHTYDSVTIRLKQSNAFFMGDNLTTHSYLSVGEDGLAGQLEVLDHVIAASDEDSLIIPSHSKINSNDSVSISKLQLIEYKNRNIHIINYLKTLYQRGDSLEVMKKDQELRELTRKFILGKSTEQEIDASLDWWLGKAIELEFSSKGGLSQTELGLYAGLYRGDKFDFEVFEQKGRLFIRAVGMLVAELVRIKEHHFDLKGYFFERNNESVKFKMSGPNEVESVTLILGEDSHKGEGRMLKHIKHVIAL